MARLKGASHAQLRNARVTQQASFLRVEQHAASLAHIDATGCRHRIPPVHRDRRIATGARTARERKNGVAAAPSADAIVARKDGAADPSRLLRAVCAYLCQLRAYARG